MTKQKILNLSIEKAMERGWKEPIKNGLISTGPFPEADTLFKLATLGTIFSIDFAKAFWGEENIEFNDCPECEYPGWSDKPAWKFHLQKIVLESNPLSYLEKFL